MSRRAYPYLLAIVLCGLVVAGTAGALVQPSLYLETDPGPDQVAPGGPPGTWNWTLSLTSSTPLLSPVTAELQPEEQSWLWTTSVEPATVTFRPSDTALGTGPYTYNATGVLEVHVDRMAPAFHSERLHVEVNASGGEPLQRPAEMPTTVTVTPGFRPGLELAPDEPRPTLAAGEEEHLRLEMRSTANGPTRVTYEEIAAPAGCNLTPLHDEVGIDPYEPREVVLHATCQPGSEGGQLAVTVAQVYAPNTSVAPAEEVTATWELAVDGNAAVSAQAAMLGTSASLAGLPVAFLAMVAAVGAVVVRRWSGT